MDGTPNPTVNGYMVVLIRKVSRAKHWKISAAVVLINGVMWLKDVHIVRPRGVFKIMNCIRNGASCLKLPIYAKVDRELIRWQRLCRRKGYLFHTDQTAFKPPRPGKKMQHLETPLLLLTPAKKESS